MITDAQIHLWEADRPDRPWTDISEPNLPEPFGPERVLPILDAAGVDRTIIVPPGFMGTNNEYALECAGRHPTRMAVMGLINPAAPDAPELVERWREQPVMLGIRTHVHPRLRAFWGSDDAADAFWAACEKEALPVAIFNAGAKDYVARILREHPGLHLVIDHMGLPMAMAELDSLEHAEIRATLEFARYPNVAVKVSTSPMFVASPHSTELVRRLRDSYGARRMLWATDHTQALRRGEDRYEDALDFVRGLAFLSEDEKVWILGRAAAEYLGWPEGAPSTASPSERRTSTVSDSEPRIEVARRGGGEFSVRVEDGASAREYDVTVPKALVEELGVSAERLVEESFRFLLEREPKESILHNFTLPVIEQYFPEYPQEIRRRLQIT